MEGKLDLESGIDIYSAVGLSYFALLTFFYSSAVGWFIFNLIKAATAAG